jgi:hypothetical protein
VERLIIVHMNAEEDGNGRLETLAMSTENGLIKIRNGIRK